MVAGDQANDRELGEQLGWTKRTVTESIAVSVPEASGNGCADRARRSHAGTTPLLDPEQVHQIVVDLSALRQTVDQLAAGQDKMARNIDTLQAADEEILVKIPEPPPPPIAAAPAVAGRPARVGSAPSENTQNTAPCELLAVRMCKSFALGSLRENGGVIKCLNSHRMELSPTCDAYFNQMPVHRAAQKGAPKVPSPNR